jgi:Flp pilus assembly protein TadB
VKRLRVLAAVCGASVGVVVGGRAGLAAGAAVVAVLWWALPRMAAASAEARLRREAAGLPAAADLLAAALRAGAPPGQAADVVGVAVAGPVGGRLVRVGHALRLGDAPAQGWAHVADLPGGERVARAAVRSADSGAALAIALTRLADELRAARAAAADAAARRAGVLVVLPLGMCFLPAFLLAGVVPVVIAVLDGVLG